MKHRTPVFGLVAEFETPTELLAAVRKTRAEGYQNIGAYTPFPVEGLTEALGFHHSRLPLVVLIGGIIGCITGFGLQYYAAVVSYPVNVAGRPLNSWPSFIPITFEMTILFASLSAVLGMLGLNGLPAPYHPLFNVERFARASRDRFFLCIQGIDPRFDLQATHAFLTTCQPRSLSEVPH
jgi:hypothetical protein